MDNFSEWSVDLKSNLLMREAREAVVGYDDEEGFVPDAVELRRRVKMNRLALCFIFKSVSTMFLSDISDLESASEAYLKLEELTCSRYGLLNAVCMFKTCARLSSRSMRKCTVILINSSQ